MRTRGAARCEGPVDDDDKIAIVANSAEKSSNHYQKRQT